MLTPSKYDWNYAIYSNTSCQVANGYCWLPRAKLIGGCPNVNFMYYVRSTPRNHEKWVAATDSSWDYSNALKYYLKAERNQNLNLVQKYPMFHNTSGKLVVSAYAKDDFVHVIMQAGLEKNIPIIDDINAYYHLGNVLVQGTLANGVRQSVAKNYLVPAVQSKKCNLNIIKNGYVTKIIIKNGKAIGVNIDWNGKKMKAYARKEVIVSGGAFNTPQILMLSGIGPRAHLQANKIPVKVDSPRVGKHLQDHVAVYAWVKFNPNFESPLQLLLHAFQYAVNRQGNFGGIGSLRLVQFLSSAGETDPNAYADLEWYNRYFPQASFELPLVMSRLNFTKKYTSILQSENINSDIMLVAISLLNPYSDGTVQLNGNNPYTQANINMNYFSDGRDLDRIIKGLLILKDLLGTETMRERGAEFIDMSIPNTKHLEYLSYDYFREYVRVLGETVWHPCCTSAMGKNINTGVVDSRLRVFGVDNLRVVDASV